MIHPYVHMMSLTLHVDQIPTYTNLGSYNLELLQLGPLLPSKFMPSENHYKTDMNLTQGRDPPNLRLQFGSIICKTIPDCNSSFISFAERCF